MTDSTGKRQMTEQEAVALLDAMDPTGEAPGIDQEHEHYRADDILLALAPESVRTAYAAARERVGFWYA